MDAIGDLLKQRSSDEPDVILNIKSYIKNTHNEKVAVRQTSNGYTITTASAPMASIIRMDLHNLIKECSVEGRISIRISLS